MSHKQKKKKNTKKKLLIISAFLLILLFISAVITATVIYFQNKNKELTEQEANILYYNESESEEGEVEEGEENVLVVGLNENTVTNEQTETTEETTQESSAPYYIKINNQANVVTIYKKDSNGEYTVPIKAMICSVGTATPSSGVYSISDKYTWRLLQGNVYGQYACRITGHILFHSVPYEKKDKSTLEWWEYDKLGTKASLGCIRLTVEDAKWIYDNCVSGTKVEFYSSSDPGPLGKPTARKISDDTEVRNWDPTDPDSNNPWKDYLANQETEENTETEQTTTEAVEDNSSKTENNTNVNNENTATNNTTESDNTSNTQNTSNTTNTVKNTNTTNTTDTIEEENTIENDTINEV